MSQPKVTIRTGAPHTFGWLRLPAFDRTDATAWERPDGMLVLLPAGVTGLARFVGPALKPDDKAKL